MEIYELIVGGQKWADYTTEPEKSLVFLKINKDQCKFEIKHGAGGIKSEKDFEDACIRAISILERTNFKYAAYLNI